MNQKKTSKKTSLFEPTFSRETTFSKENLRIARPSELPELPKQEEQTESKTDDLHNDFKPLEKYYENLNSPLDLDNSNSSNQQPDSQFNQTTSNQNELNNRTDQMDKKTNYSSYFGINRLTNYFGYNKDQSNQSNEPTISTALNPIDDFKTPQVEPVQQLISSPSTSSFLSTHILKSADPYQLPKPHWFYKVPLNSKRKDSNDKNVYEQQLDEAQELNQPFDDSNQDENWLPFAFHDNAALEKAYLDLDSNPNVVVPTNGNRYDCYIKDRYRKSIYWEDENQPIRRCTWYYKKEGHTRFIPYTEQFAFKLEQIYYDVLMNNKWNERIELNSTNQEMIIFYSYNSIIHYELLESGEFKDEWNTVNENPIKPKVVLRELTIDELQNYDVCLNEDESFNVEHLVFLVHGVGAICDFRLRTIKEVVDDLRKISFDLTRIHFRENDKIDQRMVGRCEFIPVYWHDLLHGPQTHIDERLKSITLPSVPKLRAFANDSVLDALFYTSKPYSQHIINVVTQEINRLYDLFLVRNPYFKGTVSLCGHSLGSVILFDLLANQGCPTTNDSSTLNNEMDLNVSQAKKLTDEVVYSNKTVNHGQESIIYPKLKFDTDCFFALGSPISMFLTLRGITQIDKEFHFPNCLQVYNLFHPLDPIAYRLEPMLDKEFTNVPPVTVPHHKGRKRMHLEIKENLMKVGSDIKEKFIGKFASYWNSVNSLVGGIPRSSSNLSEINELNQQSNADLDDNGLYDFPSNNGQLLNRQRINVGNLNRGQRLDYMLQEKPIEFFNQYIFALATHACYWQSEDSILFMLKELYKLREVYASKEADDGLNLESTESNQMNVQNNSNLVSSTKPTPNINFNQSIPNSSNSQQQPTNKNFFVSTSIDIE